MQVWEFLDRKNTCYTIYINKIDLKPLINTENFMNTYKILYNFLTWQMVANGF